MESTKKYASGGKPGRSFLLNWIAIAMVGGAVIGFTPSHGAGEASARARAVSPDRAGAAESPAPEANADRSIYDHFHRY